MRNRLVWLAMIAIVAGLALHTRDNFDAYFAGVGTLDVVERPEARTLFLRWRGSIDAPMAGRITEAFDAHRDSIDRIVLALSSAGGSLDHGAQVVRLLRTIAATHRLETVIEPGRRCASMCVPVYLQGEKRSSAPNARFMFHEVSFVDAVSNDALDVPSSARASATDRLFARYFETAGVPRDWIAAIRREMAGGADVWKTGAELVRENAGIVQALSE